MISTVQLISAVLDLSIPAAWNRGINKQIGLRISLVTTAILGVEFSIVFT
jgi:hypothetical protein